MVPIKSTLYNISNSMQKGHKKFSAIESTTGNISHIGSKDRQFKISVLRNALTSVESNAEVRLSGTRDVNHLIVVEHLNNVHMKDLFKNLYYVEAGSVIKATTVYYFMSYDQVMTL
uniref:(northern house mosquito) hypothetical protein n=1 Tax=Culex pipiens TaxID=7175 RepID=A0A8D8MK37_CULPI